MCFVGGWVVVDMLGISPWLDRLTGGGILGSVVSTVAVGAVSWSAVTTGWPIRLLGRLKDLRLPAGGNRAAGDGFAKMAAGAASVGFAFDGDRTAVFARDVADRAAEAMRSSGRKDERFVACGQTAVVVVDGSMLAMNGARGFIVDGAALEAALALTDGAFVRLPATPLDKADSKELAVAITEAVANGTKSSAGEVFAIGDDALADTFGPSQTTTTAAEADGHDDGGEPDYEAAFGPAVAAMESRVTMS